MFVHLFILAADETPRGDSTAWIIIAFGVVLFAYVLMRQKRKEPLDRASAFPKAGTSLAQQRSVERQMSNLLVELSEMSRTISATIDTRAAKLQVLIDDADRRIATLQALQADANAQPIAARETSQPSAPTSETETLRKLLLDGDGSASTAPLDSIPSIIAEQSSDPRHDEVYAMADEGRSIHDIATALSRPRGEIELILALRAKVA